MPRRTDDLRRGLDAINRFQVAQTGAWVAVVIRVRALASGAGAPVEPCSSSELRENANGPVVLVHGAFVSPPFTFACCITNSSLLHVCFDR
jgi:hypothetical protein